MNINLCFHGIGTCTQEREVGESRYWVSEPLFLRILDEVAEHPHVQLSFDDGNQSDVLIGLAALQERGLVATFFALAGRLEDPASLSPTDLTRLRSEGMAIGSHGWAHIPWRGLTEEDTKRELVEARTVLAAASGGPVETAALPLGRYDRRLLRRLKQADYTTVFSSDRFPARPDSWLQARYSVTAGDTIESIRSIIGHRGLREARNLLSSAFKRLR